MRPPLEEAYAKVQEMLDQKNLDAAVETLSAIVAHYPQEARVHNDLAALLTRKEEFQRALGHYQEAVALDPQNMISQKNLADLYAVVFGRFEEALQLYSRVLKVDPEDEESLVALAKIAEATGDMKNSNLFLQRLRETYPDKYANPAEDESPTLHPGKNKMETPITATISVMEDQADVDVTAIVSTYNSERFMRGCLENLLSQGLEDRLEIIVIDACSQESEATIVHAFQRKYNNIVYVRTENREGLYASWNRAIRMARGRYLTNANTDDRHLPDSLAVRVQALDRFPEVGMVYADIWSTNVENDHFDSRQTDRFIRYSYPDFTPLTGLAGSNFSPHPMWRKSAHKRVGYFDESLTVAGDYAFFYDLAVSLGALHIPDPLGLYLQNASGIEFSNREIAVAEFRKIRQQNYARLSLETVFPRLLETVDDSMARSAAFWELGNNCLMATLARECELAIDYYTKARAGIGDQAGLMNNLGLAHLLCGEKETALSILRSMAQTSLKSRVLLQQIETSQTPVENMAFKLEQPVHAILEGTRQGRRISLEALKDLSTKGASGRGMPVPTEQKAQADLTQPEKVQASQSTACMVAAGQSASELIASFERVSAKLPGGVNIRCIGHLSSDKERQQFEAETGITIETGPVVARINDIASELTGDDPYLWVLDSGTWVGRDAARGMLECLRNVPDAGLVGGLLSDHRSLGPATAKDPLERPHFDGLADAFFMRFKHRRHITQRLESRCWIFRKSVWAQLEGLDDRFLTVSTAFEDFAIRSVLVGYYNVTAADVMVWQGRALDQIRRQSELQDRRRFEAKWRDISMESALGRNLLAFNTIEKASQMALQNNLQGAVKSLTEGVRRLPGDQRLPLALSRMLISSQQYHEALDILENLTDEKTCSEVLELKGYCLEGLESYEAAQALVQELMVQEPKKAVVINLAAMLAFRLGDADGARELFEQAILTDPGFGDPHANLGVMAFETGDSKKAFQRLARGFTLTPDAPHILTNFHAAAATTQNFDIAGTLFEAAMALHPDNKAIRFHYIDLMLKADRFQAAMTAIETAFVRFGVDDDFLKAALEVRHRIGAMQVPESVESQNQTVSLCMIVKNEADCLAHCLQSIKPVVDEIVIVDTGSSDQTKAIAKAFGARVFDFQWHDDFSSARNFSIDQARGNWILVLDADEVLAPEDLVGLKEIVDSQRSFPVAVGITTRNYVKAVNTPNWTPNRGEYPLQEVGSGWYPSTKVRLFSNHHDLRFVHPVHELVDPSAHAANIEIVTCDLPVHHYGKLEQAQIRTKGTAYFELGLKKIAKGQGDQKEIMELAAQASELKRYKEASQLWQNVIQKDPHNAVGCLNWALSLMELGDYKQAKEVAARARALDPSLKEAALNQAISCLCTGAPQEAIGLLEPLLKKLPDHPVARAVLSAAFSAAGREDEAVDSMQRLAGQGYDSMSYLSDLIGKMLSQKLFSQAQEVAKTALAAGVVGEDVFDLIND